MDSTKKIILYNSNQRFREGFIRGCEKNEIDLTLVKTRHAIIHLKNNNSTKFIYKNKEFDVHNSLNFFQIRGKEPLMPAIIALYCKLHKIYFNDPVNTEHTQEGLRKVVQMMLLHENNLPIPESIILNQHSYQKNRKYILKNVSFPIVLKGDGDQGQAVWKIESLEELDKRMKLPKKTDGQKSNSKKIEVFLLQEYIPNTHDFRVTMFEGEVLGVIKRSSKDGFYNNYSQGADWEKSKISKEETDLCQKACKACEIDLGGVDFVRTTDGILFFEVNKGPMINVKYPEIIVDRLAKKHL